MNHLTTGRIDGNAASKVWEVGKILIQIDAILRDVASKASPKKLHAKVRLFQQPSDKILAWIGDNVCHTNTVVSAPITVTVLSDTSASTATGMVGKIKPDQP